jgi:hypothetical protein
MKHLTYVGRNQQLKGKTALVRDDPVTCAGGNFGMVLAQFDEMDLEVNGEHMAFGWHLFKRGDFE